MSDKSNYMREYMKKRREDPEFKRKQAEYQRKYVAKQKAIIQAVKQEDVEKPVDSKMVFIKMLLISNLSVDIKAQVLYEISKTD